MSSLKRNEIEISFENVAYIIQISVGYINLSLIIRPIEYGNKRLRQMNTWWPIKASAIAYW